MKEVRGKLKEPSASLTILGWTCLGPKGDSSCKESKGVAMNIVHNEIGENVACLKLISQRKFMIRNDLPLKMTFVLMKW